MINIEELDTGLSMENPGSRRKRSSNPYQKEALMKAFGQGLSIPLNRFDVSVGSRVPTRMTYEGWGFPETTRWSLWELNLGANYVGAVVVKSDTRQVQCFNCKNTPVPSVRLAVSHRNHPPGVLGMGAKPESVCAANEPRLLYI